MISHSNLNISNRYTTYYSEKGSKPLCFIENDLLVYNNMQLFLLNLNDFSKIHICDFKTTSKQRLMSNSRLLTRLLRLEPRGVVKIDDNNVLISFKGNIYHLRIESKNLELVHEFRKGMSAPLTLTAIKNIEGFDEQYCYGEYFSNPEKEEVSIYGCDKDVLNWHELYKFKKGEINHIHSIIPDPYQNRVWIFTGDFGDAAGIWYTDNNFKTVERYLWGNQQYRACVGFPTNKGLIYATDTPLENNNIYIALPNKELKKLYELKGSSIYGMKMQDNYIFSTAVEGNSDGEQGNFSLLSYKRGKGIKSWYSQVVIGNLEDGFETVASFKKDFLPMGLMQFGTITFPSGNNPTNKLVFYGNSLQRIDGKLMILVKDIGG